MKHARTAPYSKNSWFDAQCPTHRCAPDYEQGRRVAVFTRAVTRKTWFSGLILCLLLGVSSKAKAWETIVVGGQSYLFEPIDTPTPGATSVIHVSGINNNGVMVGTFKDFFGKTFGFVRGPGIPFKEITDGSFTELLKVNDFNTAVGNSATGAFVVTLPNGSFFPLNPPAAGYTNLSAAAISDYSGLIEDSGAPIPLIVGEVMAMPQPFATVGFEGLLGLSIFEGISSLVLSSLDPFSPGNSALSVFPNTVAVHPHSIALSTQFPSVQFRDTLIVGRIEQSGGGGGAFLVEGDPTDDLNYTNISQDLNSALQTQGIQSGPSDAQGVNAFGIVVGSFIPSADISRGFMDEANLFTVIDAPNSNSTELFDINDKLQIVGGFRDNQDNMHGFVMTPLNSPVPGASPTNPLEPNSIVVGGVTCANPAPGHWFDSPLAASLTYTLAGDATFTEIGALPASFEFGPVALIVNGSIVKTLNPGQDFFFGPGVTTFSLVGISPPNAANPVAFPPFLDFTGTATSLTIAADTTPPVISISASPESLWPPSGTIVPVAIAGTIADSGTGVNARTATYAVTDEYGLVQPGGAVSVAPNGSYSFALSLPASRHGDDKDGRHYTITVQAQDNAGNAGSASTIVTVPHDQRK